MSFFERIVPAFLRYGEKVTVDSSAAGADLPVADQQAVELLEEIRDLLNIVITHLEDITDQEINSDQL